MSAKLFDSHTHTHFSMDSGEDPKNLVETAVKMGAMGIAITDHCEMINHEWEFSHINLPKSIKTAHELKALYSERLIISAGVEIGEATFDPAKTKAFFDTLPPLDFILGSCHTIKSGYDFYLFTPEDDINKILREYFELMIELCENADIDILAHLTYPLRYIIGNYGIKPDMQLFKTLIDRLLETAIKKEIGMEINTSGYRKKFGMSMPTMDIVKRYYDMGGRLITLGSDAHVAEDILHSFDMVIAEMKEIGFSEYCYYLNREAKFIEI